MRTNRGVGGKRPPRGGGSGAARGKHAHGSEVFFEEVIGIRIVVEPLDLGPAGGLVEADGFGEGGVGVEAQGGDAEGACCGFGGVHEAFGEAEAACGGGDPEAFDLGVAFVCAFEADAADGFVFAVGDEEGAAGRAHVVGFGVGGEGDVEPLFKPCGQFAVIGREAGDGVGVLGVGFGNADGVGGHGRGPFIGFGRRAGGGGQAAGS